MSEESISDATNSDRAEHSVPPGEPAPGAKLLIGVLVAAAFVVILNETTLAVALPVLMGEFGVTADAAQWLTTAFMLTMAVVIPMTGYIMQRFRLRSIYATALTTFLVGTVLAAAAPTFPILLLARVIQASGTALVIPMLMTTIIRLVPINRRGAVFGLVSVVIAVAPALGPTFSGVVLEALGWRWIFILVAPLVLISLVAGLFLVKNFEEPSRPSLDVLSVFLSAFGFAGLVYGLAGLSELADGLPVQRLIILAAGAVILAVFFLRQRSLERSSKPGATPLLNLQPVRVREYNLSLGLLLFTFSMLFGFIILMPLYAQNVAGLSELKTGMVSLPGGLVMGLLGPAVGRAYDARGARPLIIPGSILITIGMMGFAALEQTEHLFSWVGSGTWPAFVQLMLVTVVLNLGIALMMTPLMSNALAAVPDSLASHAQAILNTFQQVAGGAGTAIFVAVMTFASTRYASSHAAELAGLGATDPALAEAQVVGQGIHVAFLVAAFASVVLMVAAAFVKLDARESAHPGAPQEVA
ncbi:DHA2 family efflux MFS transporter permease subunit [Corynebacterium sp. HMSC08A12]|uniref:DHA2 family efflux MFS transporter permease subunit n=1 Tax=Corynebacterium sp. HMSC08A12 TaxID=1581134 RepID=UPI000A89D849|nr:DHA2 family efflux MFS transporter permease subunit [Corynebacterium sp. HMSC08A12]